MTKPFAKRGARPLNENPDLVRTLVEYLLKVSTDKRFTSGQYKHSTVVLRKLLKEGNVPFEKLCMEAISSNKNENENVNELELAVIKVPAACDLGAAIGPINHFKDVILPMMIAGEGDFQFNNDDEKAAILVVLGLKIEDETIIDLKTNAPLKTAAEKQRDREQQPENKAKKREYNQMYNQREDVKENRREYDQREDVKENRREYDQRDDVKEKRREREQRDDVKEKRREREQQPEKKEKKSAYNQEYNQRPDVKENRREYNQRPDVKEKKRARKEERKRFFVKKQRQITPPYGSNGGCCTMCARKRSIGWMSVVEFCFQIEEDFDNEGLFERQRAEQTCRFLNRIKKKAAKDGEYSKIRSKDVLCLRCLYFYKRSATKKIKKILKA